MQCALSIYRDKHNYDALSDEQREAVSREYDVLRTEPQITATSAALARVEGATTLRARGGETYIADGPFADTNEVFGGVFLLEADNLDAAHRPRRCRREHNAAQRSPGVHHGWRTYRRRRRN